MDSTILFSQINFAHQRTIKLIIFTLSIYANSKKGIFSNTTLFIKENVQLFHSDPVAACGNFCALGGWICTNRKLVDAHFYGLSAVYDLCDELRHHLRIMRYDSGSEFSDKALKHYVSSNELLTQLCLNERKTIN